MKILIHRRKALSVAGLALSFFCTFGMLESVWGATQFKARKQVGRALSSQKLIDQREITQSVLTGVKVRPLFGVSFIRPSELNRYILRKSTNQRGGEIGAGAGFGIAVEYPLLSDRLLVGVGFGHFLSSGDSVLQGSGGVQGAVEYSVSGLPAVATTTYLIPVFPSWSLAPSFGLGAVLGYRVSEERSSSRDFLNAPNGTLSYSATPWTILLGLGLIHDLNEKIGARLDLGYGIVSSRDMQAQSKLGKVSAGDLLRDGEGRPVEVDGSGLRSELSLVVTL